MDFECIVTDSSQLLLQHLDKMNSRVREDEKHEMIIRKLLKNTDNKRCINCGSLVCLSTHSVYVYELCFRIILSFSFDNVRHGRHISAHC